MINGLTNRNLMHGKIGWPSFLTLFLLIQLTACSSAYRYKVLSFFFDGVSGPAKIAPVQPVDTLKIQDTTLIAQNIGAEPILKFHPPYQQKDCSACHDQNTTGKQIKPMPDLCYQCHLDFATRYKVLHGPVGGGECTACHNPHFSTNGKLLIRKNQDMCLFCHESDQIMKTNAHLEIKDIQCTECHNPHGGEDRYVLK
jgi:predicted CXXCH cytochrome family protein